MSKLFSNLFTKQEREELSRRLQIFRKLLDGNNQRDISRALGVGIATVTRGSRELKQVDSAIREIINK
jgi:TrpR family trp operon transcriptional repressor